MLESPSVAQGHKLLTPRPRTPWQTLTLCPYSEDSDGGLPAGATSLEMSSKPVADMELLRAAQRIGCPKCPFLVGSSLVFILSLFILSLRGQH